MPRHPHALSPGFVLAAALALAGCGGSGSSSSTQAGHSTPTNAAHRAAPARKPPVRLHVAGRLGGLPEARSGIAAALFGGSIYVNGGLSAAGTSTDTVFKVGPSGAGTTAGTLPGAIHDAAAAGVGDRLIVFGGGESEGSNRIIQVLPGTPRLIGSLPQALSDLVAVSIGSAAYVVGGWNGSSTNSAIYRATATGTASPVGSIPLGVRYPAVAALGGRVIVAGGETSASTPTTDAWSFDPATRHTSALPHLPVPTDHASGAVINGRFYLIGGLRNGAFTDAIISWAPGESRWRSAGHLPTAISDQAAIPFDGGIAVLGGRGSAGQVATVSLLKAG